MNEKMMKLFVFVLATTALCRAEADSPGCDADIAFVIDNSGSIRDKDPPGGNNWQLILDFVKNIMQMFNVGPGATRFAVVDFGNAGRLDLNFYNYSTVSEVVDAVNRIPYLGENTNTTGGLKVTRTQVFGSSYQQRGVDRVIILITDGVPTRDVSQLPDEVAALKGMGVWIIAVGVTNEVNETILKSIVSYPADDNYVYAPDYNRLDLVKDLVRSKTCKLVRTFSTTVQTPPSGPGVSSAQPPATAVVPIKPTNGCNADLVFVIDNSGSIRDSNQNGIDNWQLILDFVKSIVQLFDVSPGASRVAVVDFGNAGRLDFNLNNYTTKADLVAAVDRIPYLGENTNTTGGLRVARTQVFGSGYDNRGYGRIMILITDGVPTRETDKLFDEAAMIKSMGIGIIAIGVTDQVNETILRSIVTQPAANAYVYAPRYDALDVAKNLVVRKTCNMLMDMPSSTATTPGSAPTQQFDNPMTVPYSDGAVSSSTTTKSSSSVPQSPSSTTLPTPDLCVADIAFVIDNSGSIRDNNQNGIDNWKLILDFVKSIAQMFDISPSASRIAVVDFGNAGRLDFNLKNYTTSSDVLAAVDRISYLGENTNTTGGLKVARTQVFGSTYEYRDGVGRAVVLITDGVATRDADKLSDEASAIKGMNIRIVAVGVTAQVNETVLRSLVTQPSSDAYIYAPDYNNLDTVKRVVMSSICRNVVVWRSSPRTPVALSSFQDPVRTDPVPTNPANPGQTNQGQSITAQTTPSSMSTYICNHIADITFVLDNSGSIRDNDPPGGNNWQLILNFVQSIVQMFNIGPYATRIAVVDFGNFAKVDLNLSAYSTLPDVLSAVGNISYLGENTNMTGGLRVARTQVFGSAGYWQRPGIDRIIVLMTDGVPTREVDQLFPEADTIKGMGIEIIGVGVTDKVNDTILRRIVTAPSSSSYIYASDYSRLNEVKDLVFRRTCSDFISPTPSMVAPTVVKDPAPLVNVCVADIAFVIDNSGSIRDNNVGDVDNWQLILNFVKNIIGMFDVGPSAARIAVVDFGNAGRLDFNLKNYSTEGDIVAAVDRINYLGENTNTTGGLRVARTQVFGAGYEQRTGIDRIIFLITDGVPTREVAQLYPEADQIKNMGIRIVGLGVTHMVNETIIRTVVNQPSDRNYVYASNYNSLDLIRNLVVDDCKRKG